jgi:hypothetical protein
MLFVASGFVGQMFDMSSGKSLRSVAGHSGMCNPRESYSKTCLFCYRYPQAFEGIITSVRYLGGVLCASFDSLTFLIVFFMLLFAGIQPVIPM